MQVMGVILDTCVLVNSLGLYMSLTWLDVRETPEVRELWYKMFALLILAGYGTAVALCVPLPL